MPQIADQLKKLTTALKRRNYTIPEGALRQGRVQEAAKKVAEEIQTERERSAREE